MGQDVYIDSRVYIRNTHVPYILYIYINRQIFVLSTSVGLAVLAPIISNLASARLDSKNLQEPNFFRWIRSTAVMEHMKY